jgi:guanylate kinase
MLEHTFFNNWYYGTSKDSVSEDTINIGVFNPAGIRSLEARDDVELITAYIHRPAKLRLMGQLTREEHPDVSEIIRRAAADERDFAALTCKHTLIPNEVKEDLVMGPARLVELLDKFN